MNTRIDVLGLGCTAVDELLYVTAYPAADSKTRVLRRDRQCGGLTATALIAAARLGARCAYAGRLGDDDASQFVRQSLVQAGIRTDVVARDPKARPVRSVIVVDERQPTRTIFYDDLAPNGAHPRRPARALIAGSRVLLVDRFGVPGMIRAARLARASGTAVVADFEHWDWDGFEQLFPLPDHLIVSEEFACGFTRTRTPASAIVKLWDPTRRTVVVTAGANGCWFCERAQLAPVHLPAYRVAAVDTTGCGDVFHGAYAAALVRGLPVRERLHLASATAALKAQSGTGSAGLPTWRQVQAFLEAREPAPAGGSAVESRPI